LSASNPHLQAGPDLQVIRRAAGQAHPGTVNALGLRPGATQRPGFHLQLSGHTHGGQFWPWGFFVRLQQPFTAGLHRLHGLWVHTSRGTGHWGPPKRFLAPSEISRLRLVPGRG
jgi:hypothetical protein